MGFEKHLSAVTQLLSCTTRWSNYIDSGCFVVIHFDLTKAFDSVCQTKLLYKLSKYCVSGNLLKCLRAFLSSRSVCISGKVSGWKLIKSGVPQESVLGYIYIFANDMFEVIKFSDIDAFADDTKLSKGMKHIVFFFKLNIYSVV